MDKEREFENVIIGVSASGDCFLIQHDELCNFMDGSNFEDNALHIEDYPKEPGVYRCTIEYWFEQGYFEGWKADGESDWDFIPTNIKKLNWR